MVSCWACYRYFFCRQARRRHPWPHTHIGTEATRATRNPQDGLVVCTTYCVVGVHGYTSQATDPYKPWPALGVLQHSCFSPSPSHLTSVSSTSLPTSPSSDSQPPNPPNSRRTPDSGQIHFCVVHVTRGFWCSLPSLLSPDPPSRARRGKKKKTTTYQPPRTPKK